MNPKSSAHLPLRPLPPRPRRVEVLTARDLGRHMESEVLRAQGLGWIGSAGGGLEADLALFQLRLPRLRLARANEQDCLALFRRFRRFEEDWP
jgi:hypothetical protein